MLFLEKDFSTVLCEFFELSLQPVSLGHTLNIKNLSLMDFETFLIKFDLQSSETHNLCTI